MKQRLIDANHLLANSIRIEGNINLQSGKVQRFESISVAAIEAAETVDAVEVVRCSGCEYYSPGTMKCFKPVDDEHTFYDYAAPIWKPQDFCSYGKRKGAQSNAGDL